MRDQAFDFLFKAHPTPMFFYELDSLRIVDVNEAALNLYGFSREEFLQKTIKDLRPPEEIPALLETLAEVRASGGKYRRHEGYFTHWKKDGTRLQVEIVSYGVELDGKRLRITSVHDITERLRIEEKLRESESRFRRMLDSDFMGIVTSNRSGQVLEANDAFLKIVGYDRKDLEAGRINWLKMTPPEYAEIEKRGLEELERTGVTTPFEKEYFRKDGSRVPVIIGAAFILSNRDEGLCFVIDVSKTRAAEQARRESERQFKALVEAAPVIFYRTDDKGVVTLVEGQGMARLRKDPRKALGHTVHERYRKYPDLTALYDRAMAGETVRFEVELDGEWFDSVVGPMRDENGRIDGVVGVSTVITERKRVERAWHNAEARLRFTLNNAPLTLFALDRNGITTLSEGAGLKALGLEPGEMVGKSALEMFANDPPALSLLRRTLAGEEVTTENRVGDLWFGIHFRPLFDQRGKPDGMVGVSWDITDRKRAEHARHESEERLRFTISTVPITLFATDRKGNITLSEGAALASLGTKPGELVGLNVFGLYKDEPEVADEFRRVLEKGETLIDERMFGGILFERHVIPVRDATGAINGLVGIAWDITERKRSEDERGRLNQELREALRARDEFLSVAAHELRTPLTTLRMQMELVSSYFRGTEHLRPSAEQLRRVAELGEIEFDRLTKLIHNLLDVARIRAGKLELQRGQTDLAEVSRLTAERFAAQAQVAGSSISVDAPAPVLGNWDRYRIEQILVNLVFNAIKYAARSPITVRVFGGDGKAIVEVGDRGPGISESDQVKIFNRFERLDTTTSGGMGLGLFISKEIAEAHGGRLTVQSRMGQGSVFRLELPA